MRIWFISDTHMMHQQLTVPKGIDMICHCGDFSNSADTQINFVETLKFLEWFESLDVEYKILGAGNHDTFSEKNYYNFNYMCKSAKIIPLIHKDIEIEGLKIFATPYTPRYGRDWAYNLDRGTKLERKWNQIPDDIDILMSHGPCKGILDWCWDKDNRKIPVQAGSKTLLNAVRRIEPKIFCAGHIHQDKIFKNYGVFDDGGPTKFINAACWDFSKDHLLPGQVIEIKD